ncbi:hypothetical protein LUZ61_023109 [Rhynchospora tenuis]|uniref:SWIM-type domain-containing protein n=1 Tax=Rhynchospora tenuis TaxID=198213 RepID=A0AAD5W689_9POAL|nr:hypothetical protein LUZ61_023109 [Rhynchospora tenuis]
MKCYRAKDKAINEVRGPDDDSYIKLPEYLHMLKLANPDTITFIKTQIDDDGVERFLYAFLSFGASIRGFRKLRHVVVFDVVDSENDESWTWFLQKLGTIIAGNPILTLISDRHSSIRAAKQIAFPMANHGACIVHIQRNVNAKFRSKGLAKLVGQAGFAFRVGSFKQIYAKITTANPDCAKYLEKIGMAHWTRAYFRGGSAQGKKKSLACRGSVTPEVEKVMNSSIDITKGSKINPISNWSCEIVGQFGHKHHVIFDQKVCTCAVFIQYKIPCGHALLAADHLGIPYASLCGVCYRKQTWIDTYAGEINPDGCPEDVDIPDDIKQLLLMPPKTRRPSGRPKE